VTPELAFDGVDSCPEWCRDDWEHSAALSVPSLRMDQGGLLHWKRGYCRLWICRRCRARGCGHVYQRLRSGDGTTFTDIEGSFSLDLLQTGENTMVVDRVGLSSSSRTVVTTEANTVLTQNVTMDRMTSVQRLGVPPVLFDNRTRSSLFPCQRGPGNAHRIALDPVRSRCAEQSGERSVHAVAVSC